MADKLVVFLPGFGNVEIPLIDFDPKRKPLDMLESRQSQKKTPKTNLDVENENLIDNAFYVEIYADFESYGGCL